MKQYILKLKEGLTFSSEEAYSCFQSLFENEDAETEIVEFLTILSSRNPSSPELFGFLSYLSEHSNKCLLESDLVFDVCGTGGDGKNTINISTLAAFILAAMGEKVAKHGNYSASSSIGSSNLLEALSVPLVDSEQRAQEVFSKTGIVFLHAPFWHPRLKKIAQIRKKLGIRTVFNLLGPLLNPAKPKFQLIGSPSLATSKLLKDVLSFRAQSTADKFAVISDRNGYDEVSLTGSALVSKVDGELEYSPIDFGVEVISPESIVLPTSIEEVVSVSKRLLAGLGEPSHENVVAANVALALQLRYPESDIKFLFEKAIETIRSGLGIKVLNALRGCK